jgi:hypothetical protein
MHPSAWIRGVEYAAALGGGTAHPSESPFACGERTTALIRGKAQGSVQTQSCGCAGSAPEIGRRKGIQMPSLQNSMAPQPSPAGGEDEITNTTQKNPESCAHCGLSGKGCAGHNRKKPARLAISIEANYCGSNLQILNDSSIVAKTHPWDLDSYLDRMYRAPILLPAAEIAERREFFIEAAQTEFDAEFLCQHLEQSGVSWTPEFLAFEREWRRDEYRHYVGFRCIYGRLYPDAGETALKEEIESALPDFTPIQSSLRDEFNVLTAIMFDEACTAKSYADELKFYARFGDPVFAEWVRHIAHDEANHMNNTLAVLKARHAHRLAEVPALLDGFVAHDQSGVSYRNTFLFDHESYTFEFVAVVVERLKRRLSA